MDQPCDRAMVETQSVQSGHSRPPPVNYRQKWQQKWKEVEQGFQKEGPFYLLTLRLIPIVPFFLVNILMGVTPIRWTSYVFISWIGMLASVTWHYQLSLTSIMFIPDYTIFW